MASGKVTLRITNRLSSPRLVVLEPWTGQYTLEPGKSFDIVAEGDLEYPLELEISDESVVVYSFDSPGALLSIFQDGREIQRSE